jgi:hypothetical protein
VNGQNKKARSSPIDFVISLKTNQLVVGAQQLSQNIKQGLPVFF